jgi:hypothetical protein
MKEAEYKNYVKLGKDLLGKIENYQIKICDYAMEVVTIRHGGYSKGVYTIKKYAEDIGLVPKTLQNWLQVYRNVIIKLEDPANADFKTASKVNNVLDERRTLTNVADGTVGRKTGKIHTPPERVRSLYNSYEKHEKPFEGEFINIVQQIKSFKSLLEKRDLNIIEDAHLMVAMDIFDHCGEIINQHLTKKRKANKKAS